MQLSFLNLIFGHLLP